MVARLRWASAHNKDLMVLNKRPAIEFANYKS